MQLKQINLLNEFETLKHIPLLENEEWRDVPGYENKYQVSNYGRVISLVGPLRCRRERMLKPFISNKGYFWIDCFNQDGDNRNKRRWQISRLVATVFIPNPNNLPEIHHKNDTPQDNRITNLEWTDRSGNMSHVVKKTTKRHEEKQKLKTAIFRVLCDNSSKRFEEEIWKETPNYNGYLISNFGRVKEIRTGKLQNQVIKKDTYAVWLPNPQTERSHRVIIAELMAKTFMPTDNMTLKVFHVNGNKLDNRLENLIWTNHNLYCQFTHYLEKLAGKIRKQNGPKKITENIVRELRQLRSQGISCKSIGEKFGIAENTVSWIANRRSWAHVK